VKKEVKPRPAWIAARRQKYPRRKPEHILNKRSERALDIVDQKYADVPKITHLEMAKILSSTERSQYKFIDLRNKEYVGDIPFEGSLKIKNIEPFGDSIAQTLLKKEFSKLADSAFKTKLGFDKPAKDDKIIFISNMGKRSISATQTLKELGYTNVFYLYGGLRLWFKYNPHLHDTSIKPRKSQSNATTQTATNSTPKSNRETASL